MLFPNARGFFAVEITYGLERAELSFVIVVLYEPLSVGRKNDGRNVASPLPVFRSRIGKQHPQIRPGRRDEILFSEIREVPQEFIFGIDASEHPFHFFGIGVHAHLVNLGHVPDPVDPDSGKPGKSASHVYHAQRNEPVSAVAGLVPEIFRKAPYRRFDTQASARRKAAG